MRVFWPMHVFVCVLTLPHAYPADTHTTRHNVTVAVEHNWWCSHTWNVGFRFSAESSVEHSTQNSVCSPCSGQKLRKNARHTKNVCLWSKKILYILSLPNDDISLEKNKNKKNPAKKSQYLPFQLRSFTSTISQHRRFWRAIRSARNNDPNQLILCFILMSNGAAVLPIYMHTTVWAFHSYNYNETLLIAYGNIIITLHMRASFLIDKI